MALERAERRGPRAPPRPEDTMRPWLLADLNYGHVRSHPPYEVAVLPLGATEPHNLHLPDDQHPQLFEDAGDHAGEMETSMALAHFADLVRMDQADEGRLAPTRFEAVNRGWVEITRPWHLLTTNSGAGDPRPATAAKGEALTEIVVERLAAFLVELSAAPIDERFPYSSDCSA